MRRSLWVVVCLTTCLSTLAAAAQAQESKTAGAPHVDAEHIVRLDKALGTLADDGGATKALPVLSLLSGVGYAGVGVAIATNPKQEPRDDLLRGFVVTESLVIGGVLFGYGTYGLASWGSPSTSSERYARFQRDRRAGELSSFKLGQYEGELYRDAVVARAGRRVGGFISLGAAAAGAGLLALAATSDMRGAARLLTYAEGGVMLAYGTITGVLLLSRESAEERQWHLYRTGASAPRVARWSVQPILTPHGFVLTAAGTL